MAGKPPSYLIELRVRLTKFQIKKLNKQVAHDHKVKTEYIPHITLFGPFTLKHGYNEHEMKSEVEKLVSNYELIPFLIYGFERRTGMHGEVIAYHIVPGKQLTELKKLFIKSFYAHVNSKGIADGDFLKNWFHITMVNGLTKFKVDQIWDHVTVDAAYENSDFEQETAVNQVVQMMKNFFSEHFSFLKKKELKKIYPLFIDEDVFRITITKGKKILAEYDLLQKKWLSRNQALSSVEWDNSLRYYRRKSGFELTKPDYKQGEIFIIGDTHFGHHKIIEYCARPFNPDNVPEMDMVLLNNWNFTVSPGDKVIFLGDLKYGYKSKKPQYYLDNLNGNIHFVKGNHDDELLISGMRETFELTYKDLKFLFIHDPSQVDPNYEGWIIHGHVHNNNLQAYPFINFAKKTVNVGVEVIGYKPVPLSIIYDLIISRSEDMTVLR